MNPPTDSTGAALLAAIRERPDDDATRLVYADCLDESGRPEWAELIRLQFGMSGADPHREQQLIREVIGPALPAALIERATFRRGFLAEVRTDPLEYLAHAEALAALAPELYVTLYPPEVDPENDPEPDPGVRDWADGEEGFEELAACPHLDRWAALDVRQSPGYAVRALLDSPHLTRLHTFRMRDNEAGPEAAHLTSPALANLRHIDICGSDSASGGPSDDGLAQLADCPHLAGLEYLNYGMCDAGDEGLAILAGSPTFANLRHLRYAGNGVTTTGVEAVARSPHLTRLESLDLAGQAHISQGQGQPPLRLRLDPLPDWPGLANLTWLALGGNSYGDDELLRLVRSPGVRNLRYLEIGSAHLTPDALRSLILCRDTLANLETLDVCGLAWWDTPMLPYLEALAAGALPRLQSILFRVGYGGGYSDDMHRGPFEEFRQRHPACPLTLGGEREY